jgi:hypothetical protein
MGVGVGDVFVFWGLFQPVERRHGKWVFVGAAHHRIFGWLEIGEVIDLGASGSWILERYPWLVDHPHARDGWGDGAKRTKNTLYVAPTRSMHFPNSLGYGEFPVGKKLSAVGASKSVWSVPDWLHLHRGGTGMSYHPAERWLSDGRVKSAGRGQEFVADIGDRTDAKTWLRDMIEGRDA